MGEFGLKFERLPKSPGVYLFYNSKKNLIYVGKSVSVRDRVRSYFRTNNLGPKTQKLASQIANIEYIKVFSEFEALLLEAELIKKNKPFYNIQAKDDKSPLYIKIADGDVPLISTTRFEKQKKGVITCGPFPSTRTTRSVLKTIRAIFPYCQHKKPKKPCLYVHLGLCPYPYSNESSKDDYQKTIKKIKKLLRGENRKLIFQLSREMAGASQKMQYEKAQDIKNQIEKLQFLQSTYHAPREFLERPTLVDDFNQARLQDLKVQLNLKEIPRRIECFDISNIGGRLATGSMAVFTDGQPDTGEYRKFKIKFINKPDDYQMIQEVLQRRLNNNWPKPDLVIIDGGRGQLNTALAVLKKKRLQFPLISLAKRFEEIYTPHRALPIKLTKDSQARQLAQAIRDEAHRFAISYHRLLRSKNLLK